MIINKKRILNLLILFLWMVLIFYMSSKTGEDSTKQSNFMMDTLSFIGIDFTSKFGEVASLIIRKGAHLAEYCILGLLLYNVLKDYVIIKFKVYLFIIIAVFIYASSDELHQCFVPGRAGRFSDIIIDTIGGCIGVSFIEIKIKIMNKWISNPS